MDKKTQQQLIDLNQDFYDGVAESFSQTRVHYWKGWEKIWKKHLSHFGFKSVLDWGCGNGRWGEFLYNKRKDGFEYLGADFSEKLLGLAQDRLSGFGGVRWVQSDVLEIELEGESGFDLEVMMAVWHHIPAKEKRERLAQKFGKLINNGGLGVWSFWEFAKDDRLKNKLVSIEKLKKKGVEINREELESGDCFLGWQNSPKTRYCHDFSDDEVDRLVTASGMKKVDEFWDDGKSENLNRYLVLKRV